MPRAYFKEAIPRGMIAVIALFIVGIFLWAGMAKGALKSVTPAGWAIVIIFVVFMLFHIYADWRTPKT